MHYSHLFTSIHIYSHLFTISWLYPVVGLLCSQACKRGSQVLSIPGPGRFFSISLCQLCQHTNPPKLWRLGFTMFHIFLLVKPCLAQLNEHFVPLWSTLMHFVHLVLVENIETGSIMKHHETLKTVFRCPKWNETIEPAQLIFGAGNCQGSGSGLKSCLRSFKRLVHGFQ